MRSAALALTVAALAACAGARFTSRTAPGGKPWVGYPDAEVQAAPNAHDYMGAPLCQRCHAPGDGKLLNPEPGLCYECHKAAKMTHVGKVQKPPPKVLPLQPDGRIICHTCHEPHDVKAHRHGFRAEYEAVCLDCHKRH